MSDQSDQDALALAKAVLDDRSNNSAEEIAAAEKVVADFAQTGVVPETPPILQPAPEPASEPVPAVEPAPAGAVPAESAPADQTAPPATEPPTVEPVATEPVAAPAE